MAFEISYDHVEAVLIGRAALMSSAEVHGLLTGMLCIDPELEGERWLNEVMRDAETDSDPDDSERTVLAMLFVETQRLLNDQNYSFDLLLPEDDEPLSLRAAALSEWCRGFLFGLGSGDDDQPWPEAGDEIVRDLVQISRLDPDTDDEADESSFMELQEYVRMAIQLLLSEFGSKKS